MHIGTKLKALRKQQKISQKSLAEQIGISPSFLSDIENNRSNPSFANMEKLCQALEVNIGYFLSQPQEAAKDDVYPAILQLMDEVKTWPLADQQELYSYLKAKILSKQQSDPSS